MLENAVRRNMCLYMLGILYLYCSCGTVGVVDLS